MAEAFDPMRTIPEMLAADGPLHEDDIARRLRDSGWGDQKAMPAEMDYPVGQLIDNRWMWLPAVLAGRVFTHRVSDYELAHDILAVTPDLDPVTVLCDHEEYARFADGSAARVAMAEFDDELLEQRGIPAEEIDPLGVLLLVPGTLPRLGVSPGDLVGLRLTEEGLALEPVGAVADAAVGARLAATLDGTEPPVHFPAAVWTACVKEPGLFGEPLAPLREIVDDQGLAHHGEWLAPGGFDYNYWHFERRCATLAESHDLEPSDAVAVHTLAQLCDRMSVLLEDDDAPTIAKVVDAAGEFGAALADPRLAEVLVDETIGGGRDGAVALGAFAQAVEPRVPRAARVAFRWLRAVSLERAGDIDAAERELLAAEAMNPDWPLPLLDLARYASDRGDAERGLALLSRAGAEPDEPLVELLEQFRAEPRRDVGRNDPCWCGSGRKYKKCHLGREQLPLADRARWLYAKAFQHLLASGGYELLFEVALERCRYDDGDPDALTSALTDPLVVDAVLFEGGAFEDFLATRGSLLPDDERLLAEQWLAGERSVFEVERVRRGQDIAVRDVRTGDRHEMQERTASRQLKPGQFLCARVVPAGDTMQVFGGMEPVAPHERDRLIDLLDTQPDPATLVASLTR